MILTKGRVYTLTPREQALAQIAGAERYRLNRERSTDERPWHGKSSPLEHETCSVGGEIAFARMAGLPLPPLVLEEWIGTVDLFLPDGRRVDVKTTKYQTGRLVEFLTPKSRAELYVLLVERFPRYIFKGGAHCADLLRDENELDLGHGLRYALEQTRLEAVTF